jgi:hypothetical protein
VNVIHAYEHVVTIYRDTHINYGAYEHVYALRLLL